MQIAYSLFAFKRQQFPLVNRANEFIEVKIDNRTGLMHIVTCHGKYMTSTSKSAICRVLLVHPGHTVAYRSVLSHDHLLSALRNTSAVFSSNRK